MLTLSRSSDRQAVDCAFWEMGRGERPHLGSIVIYVRHIARFVVCKSVLTKRGGHWGLNACMNNHWKSLIKIFNHLSKHFSDGGLFQILVDKTTTPFNRDNAGNVHQLSLSA